jgi:hypothetical protein
MKISIAVFLLLNCMEMLGAGQVSSILDPYPIGTPVTTTITFGDAYATALETYDAKITVIEVMRGEKEAGAYAENDPQLWDEIRQKGDAVIMAIGHWSTCTPAVVGHCLELERLGKPTAPIVTNSFVELARTNAYKRGIPGERFTFVPHPVFGKTPQEMRRDIEGKDPVTGRLVMQEIVEALTKPLTAEEKRNGFLQRPSNPRLFPPDTADNLQRYYLEHGMTDYLPIILPNEEKVAAMLKGTSHRRDEVTGKMAGGAFDKWR